MGLSSVFSTAISGLQASETTIDVAGNNVANANTVGFKASQVAFATQFLQTLGLGSAPSATSGGSNPRQTGLGTQVAAITPDFTQGTLEISANPSDLAIQGDGFFIVRSTTGEQLYTRNGKFQINSRNQLTTIGGELLLGYGVDDQFQIQATELAPITIPLGAAAVAKATENVYLEGTLSPTGDIADKAQIIETQILGDAAFSAPTNTTTIAFAETPVAPTGTADTGGSLTAGSTYRYRVVFVDPIGTESQASPEFSITLGAGENEVDLNIPLSNGNYGARRIYRTEADGTTFHLLTTINDNTTTTFSDTAADGALGSQLNTNSLSDNYSYYITFANAIGGPGNGIESRPSALVGPLNTLNQRIQLNNLPTDSSGQWSVRRIYRLSSDGQYHFVSEIPNNLAGQSFTDSVQDSVALNNAMIDLNGPRANTNTLLTNLVRRGDTGTESLFQLGTLEFAGRKGGRVLSEKTLEITSSSTVLDLLQFMEQSLGIHTPPGNDPSNIIPNDLSGAIPGGSMTADGRIRLVSNNGVDNAVSIGLSAFQLDTGGTTTSQIPLQFGVTQTAVGNSAVADFVVYDSLGIPINVRVTAVLQERTGTQSVYRWFADSADNDPLFGSQIAVGSGLITFDSEGNLLGYTTNSVDVERRNVPSSSPLNFSLDFSKLSGLAASKSSMAATRQDGFPPGRLSSFIIGEDGTIRGVFDNGTQRDLGQIQLARFANAAGLEQRGKNMYAAGVNSGLPVTASPTSQGVGSLIAGAVELSNTDIGTSLIQLISAATQYRGNARVITAAQQLLDELLNLRR